MGGPSGTKTNPLYPQAGRFRLYLFIRFPEQAKSDVAFAVFVQSMKQVEEAEGWPHWRRGSFSKKVPHSQASGPPNLWLLVFTP